jgi:hypothetical protein
VGGILTLQTPGQVEPRGLLGLKVKQPLADKYPCPREEMDRWSLPKIRNWDIRASEDHVGLYPRDFGTQGRGYFPMGKSHAPLKGRR